MASLCCFWCPASDFKDRSPGECCPNCGRPYEAPLLSPPGRIDRFVIEEPISRGYYSAV
jgi:hypothetical protein